MRLQWPYGVLFFQALITPAFLYSDPVLPTLFETLGSRIGFAFHTCSIMFLCNMSVMRIPLLFWAPRLALASGWCSSKLSKHVYTCDQVILMLAQTSTTIFYDIIILLFITFILGSGFRSVDPSISSSGSGPSGCLLAFTPWRRNKSCCGGGKLAHLFEIFLLVLMH